METKLRGGLDPKRFPVLYVDDETENLRIFKMGFRREFDVLTADSGEAALEILAAQEVAVVLSDHRMPGMSGTDFLNKVRDVDERTVRILVTAYGDAETLGAAINDGSIYRYVPKPWTAEDLGVTIRRAIELYALDREREALIRELTSVNKLAQAVNRELAPDRLFDVLLASLNRMLGYDGASLLLLEPETQRLTMARQFPNEGGAAEALAGLSLDPAKAPGFLADVMNGRSIHLRYEQREDLEPPVRTWLDEVAADEILVSPLCGKQGVIGAIAVDNRSGGRGFKEEDATLVESLAVVATIALENARTVEALRESRRQVVRAERLGTLGTLAAGLAHEINNPLVSIHTFLSLVPEKRGLDDPEFWGDYYGLTCQEVERIRGLVATMSRLGGNSGEAPVAALCDLNALVSEVVTLLSREARSREVEIEAEVDAATPKVLAVREQIHQVLLNLALNAIQASSAGGRVRMRVMPGGPGGEPGACVEVIDQGAGIGEDDLERIFDPFFTTKGPDGGTGLGLMICHRIVTDHEGTIEVSSERGLGATFRVRLPVAAGHE